MRLIDADALLENYGIKDAYRGGPLTGDIKLSLCAIRDMIEEAPTIDATPIVHAGWKGPEEPPYIKGVVCTNCGQPTFVAGNYRPNCGAKMDLKIKEDR